MPFVYPSKKSLLHWRNVIKAKRNDDRKLSRLNRSAPFFFPGMDAHFILKFSWCRLSNEFEVKPKLNRQKSNNFIARGKFIESFVPRPLSITQKWNDQKRKPFHNSVQIDISFYSNIRFNLATWTKQITIFTKLIMFITNTRTHTHTPNNLAITYDDA